MRGLFPPILTGGTGRKGPRIAFYRRGRMHGIEPKRHLTKRHLTNQGPSGVEGP